MKKSLLLLFVASLLLMSCSSDENTDSDKYARMPVYTAQTDGCCFSRTTLDNSNNILWSADDEITIFNRSTSPLRYRLSSGDGTNNGRFSYVKPSDNSSEAQGTELKNNIAVYPYSNSYAISSHTDTSYKIENIVIPAEQLYSSENNIPSGLPMTAVTEGTSLKFKNLCGLLKLSLQASGKSQKITKITIASRSTEKEKIAGICTAILPADDTAPQLTVMPQGADSITVDCHSVLLSETDAATIYIILPPVDFASGFEIKIYDTANTKMTLKSLPCSIVRNNILSMPAITYEPGSIKTIEAVVPDMPWVN